MSASRSVVAIRGHLHGRRLDEDTGAPLADVVHVTARDAAEGPAENAFVFVERASSCARYVSWINYYDLDYVVAHEPRRWQIVEPAEPFEVQARWAPFGWAGALPAPTVGDFPSPPAHDQRNESEEA